MKTTTIGIIVLTLVVISLIPLVQLMRISTQDRFLVSIMYPHGNHISGPRPPRLIFWQVFLVMLILVPVREVSCWITQQPDHRFLRQRAVQEIFYNILCPTIHGYQGQLHLQMLGPGEEQGISASAISQRSEVEAQPLSGFIISPQIPGQQRQIRSAQ